MFSPTQSSSKSSTSSSTLVKQLYSKNIIQNICNDIDLGFDECHLPYSYCCWH